MSKSKKEKIPRQEAAMVLKDKETGEEYAFKAQGDFWKNGEKWGVNVTMTTSKTEAVLFQLARYVATVEPGAPGVAEARRILQVVYQKLSSFTLGLRENGSIFADWRVKGRGAEAVSNELIEALDSDIFKAFSISVFAPERLSSPEIKPEIKPEITRGGEGVRVSAQWPKTRYEDKKAGKERKITPEEIRFEFALLTLLRDYSNHRDKKHNLYLLGNGGEAFEEARVAIGGETTSEEKGVAKAAVLEIPQAALYAAYTGKITHDINKAERRRVDGLLEKLQSDIIKITITKKIDGRVKYYEIERPKITVDRVATLTEEEAAEREMGGELPEAKTILRIKLHPGFTHDIGRRYNLFPDNYLNRMTAAIGGGRSGVKDWLLNEYLNGIRGQGKASGYKTKADFETLVTILDLGRFKAKQGARATEAQIDEAAKVAKAVGLVLEWGKEPGKSGQKQWQFTLNPDFG